VRRLSKKFDLLEGRCLRVRDTQTAFLASTLNDDRNMNSYPPELVVQLAPVMFVAGLDVPSSPEPVPSSTSDPPSLSRPAQDPFTVLTIRLRDALLSQRITAIWQPDKSKTFQTVLVDKVRSAVLAVVLSP
jgi:hypothetical protein